MIIKRLSQLAITTCALTVFAANASPIYKGKDHRFLPHKTVAAESSETKVDAPLVASKAYGLERISGLQNSKNVNLGSINQLPATAAGESTSHQLKPKDYGIRETIKR